MKKKFIIIFSIICLIIIICFVMIKFSSHKNKYDNFEHYDLEGKDTNSYTLVKGLEKETYVLADITPDNYELILTGFFYKVADNDYILLETLESSKTEAYKKDFVYQFYGDKLYGIGNPMIFEIELNKENSQIKELEFTLNGKTNPFFINRMEGIQNNIITFSGSIYLNDHSELRNFNCSLKNYECSIDEE